MATPEPSVEHKKAQTAAPAPAPAPPVSRSSQGIFKSGYDMNSTKKPNDSSDSSINSFQNSPPKYRQLLLLNYTELCLPQFTLMILQIQDWKNTLNFIKEEIAEERLLLHVIQMGKTNHYPWLWLMDLKIPPITNPKMVLNLLKILQPANFQAF